MIAQTFGASSWLPGGAYIGKETIVASNFRTGVIHRISADVRPAPLP